jgi:hypothetical protein
MRYRNKPEFTLSTAATHSMFVKLKCHLCRTTRLYHPEDIVALLGDVALWDIAANLMCETCKSREYLKADWAQIRGPDIGMTTVRRLTRIRFVRVPEWRDEHF